MCAESTVESELSYLTVEQLAQRLQVSESTIYGWAIGITFRSSWQEISLDLIRVRFTIGCSRKPIANVKRDAGSCRYVVKWRLLLAAATGKEQPDDNPKTRNTLSLRFHDPQT